MCTLTIIPIRGDDRAALAGVRVVTNRDESRKRPPALPPRLHVVNETRALWPTDAAAGGTWIAAGEHGLVLSILNVNFKPMPAPPAPDRILTRGAIIPALIHERTPRAALARLEEHFELDRFQPFRLVAIAPGEIVSARWDRSDLTVEKAPSDAAIYVSSGLGDDIVAPRLGLFAEWFASSGHTPDRQDAFHDHVWPDRTEQSVRMSRPDARTVSTTTVEIRRNRDAASVFMRYVDDAGASEISIPAPVRSRIKPTSGARC
ncbi:MAG: NRDE family protein [Planctomycetota bacterium]|nr:NRDE family protein [Planctomycetota bacterium]